MEDFGICPENQTVSRIRISGHGLTAHLLTLGATLQDLRLDGHPNSLVVGFERLEDYIEHSQHHGVTAGRVINRIGGASAVIDGVRYQLDANQDNRHMLHGGRSGYGMRNWRMIEHTASSLTLGLTDPDGAMGFPGTVTATCRYSLVERATLRVDLTASTDAPTVVNLGHHSYFCLDSSGDIRNQRLRIDASRYLPTDADCLPTGEALPVEGTEFDFRRDRAINTAFDHNFCLADTRRNPVPVARLCSPLSGIAMTLITSEPGLQFYTGHGLSGRGKTIDGQSNSPYSALCLEPQSWPDAPNHDHFPSIALGPNERYHQSSQFVFSRLPQRAPDERDVF